MILLPSICAADQLSLGSEIDKLNDWPFLHIDIEDGNFTPNITFGLKTVKRISQVAKDKCLDVHLMVTNPCDYLDCLAEFGVRMVTGHIEALPYPMIFINKAHKLGLRAGLAMNIKTSIMEIEPFFSIIDHILVMTAEPDYCNEILFLPALEKALSIVNMQSCLVDVYIDGGLSLDTIRRSSEYKIKGAVLGRMIFKSNNPYERLMQINRDING